ncbi:hypothetical protein [Actinoplanes sp. CA-252034]|uniref:hypothetical protein n=1 Tax=Actinoplanes sp. CA-252034 TaxID=3239906 RepID=UPI003D9975C0
MPLFNLLKVYGADVAKILDPGERLLAMGYIHTHMPNDSSGMDPPESRRFIEGVSWMGIHVNKVYFFRWLFGSAGNGPPGTWGHRVWQMIRNADSENINPDWAVTDKRLLFLNREGDDEVRFRLLDELPRSTIRSVRRRGKLFIQWGRCELTFVDGSTVMLTLTAFDLGAPRLFMRALSDQH